MQLKKLKTSTLIFILFSLQIFANTPGKDGFSFEIQGQFVKGKEGSWLYLNHKWEDKYFKDSTKLEANGQFKFKGKTKEQNMYWINNAENLSTPLIFFVDQEKIEISGHADSLPIARVKGGKTQNDYLNYLTLSGGFQNKKNEMGQAFSEAQNKGDQQKMMALQMEYQNLEQEEIASLYNFIKENNSSPVSGFVIYANFQENVNITKLEELYNNFSTTLKDSKYGKIASDKITKLKGTSIGYPANDFTQNTPDGKPIKLSSYKGKYVLVDFWASWCGPCRQENPNVVKAYQKFKDKGFDILGVSLDNNKDKWLKAIEKDKLTWTHVSDLKSWENAVAVMYGVRSIPTNLLIDKNGVIIAKNLR
jgi:peroxiredoxin